VPTTQAKQAPVKPIQRFNPLEFMAAISAQTESLAHEVCMAQTTCNGCAMAAVCPFDR